eukprot:comp13040_c0_seq1/m.8309 comp13040_c0_seq1/g.8309  ORF comp13040_c0_seq1/g.8309 comp13040_c0_seq1/m.8309 type:complete len:305 (+) comp13040_c0_seq1:1439-2353(+)
MRIVLFGNRLIPLVNVTVPSCPTIVPLGNSPARGIISPSRRARKVTEGKGVLVANTFGLLASVSWGGNTAESVAVPNGSLANELDGKAKGSDVDAPPIVGKPVSNVKSVPVAPPVAVSDGKTKSVLMLAGSVVKGAAVSVAKPVFTVWSVGCSVTKSVDCSVGIPVSVGDSVGRSVGRSVGTEASVETSLDVGCSEDEVVGSGHLLPVSHTRITSPVQFLPLPEGVGLVHERSCVPYPHVAEHVVHSVKPPSRSGHFSLLSHGLEAAPSPCSVQFLPPYAGAGLVHVRVCTPGPHVVVHEDHSV